MAKLTAWLVTIIGVLLILPKIGVDIDTLIMADLTSWLIAIAVLVVGIGKLIRNYKRRK